MKALSLHQPWASLIANGLKKCETRPWRTHYTGPIAIHAALKKTGELEAKHYELLDTHPQIQIAFTIALELDYDALPFGAIVATATLVDCVPTSMLNHPKVWDLEMELGNFTPGRFGWILTDVKKLAKPIPTIGRQGLFNVNL